MVGTVLIASRFIPAAESWGEVATIWFDILAAVAFVLGGGNLLKLQLKKISDRSAGWGYAAITLIAFFAMLFAGSGESRLATGCPAGVLRTVVCAAGCRQLAAKHYCQSPRHLSQTARWHAAPFERAATA